MSETSPARACRVLLVGAGHTHIDVLRRLGETPAASLALTLVSPHGQALYSGMVPGVVAGHYRSDDAVIPLGPLAARAGATFVRDHVVAVDLYTRTARLASGALAPFDLLALNVGSTPSMQQRGAREHAVGVRPFDWFLAAWDSLQSDAALDRVRTVAMVGGGAAGIELLLAMHYRLTRSLGSRAPRFALVTDTQQLASGHAKGVGVRLGRLLVQRQVVLHRGSPVVAVEAGSLVLADGRRVAADRIFFATSAGAPPWLGATGLACDEQGFVNIDANLRSVSHPFVYAAGDCASRVDGARPRSGVFAVRDGAPLAANLVRAARGEALVRHEPRALGLALITTGSRQAIAVRGHLVVGGAWAWRWKDHIDRRYIARHRVAVPLRPSAQPLDAD